MSQSPREQVEQAVPEVTPIEEMESAEAAGTLAEPAETLGSVLLEAAAPGVDEAVETVAAAAGALSEATPAEPVEGAIPLAQVQAPSLPDVVVENYTLDESGVKTVNSRVNYKLVNTVISEEQAAAEVAKLPAGSFYKKNPHDLRPAFRVYARL